jgi:hypothetical protein
VLAARLPRCRLLITVTERTALRVASLAVVAANWAYLIASGR